MAQGLNFLKKVREFLARVFSDYVEVLMKIIFAAAGRIDIDFDGERLKLTFKLAPKTLLEIIVGKDLREPKLIVDAIEFGLKISPGMLLDKVYRRLTGHEDIFSYRVDTAELLAVLIEHLAEFPLSLNTLDFKLPNGKVITAYILTNDQKRFLLAKFAPELALLALHLVSEGYEVTLDMFTAAMAPVLLVKKDNKIYFARFPAVKRHGYTLVLPILRLVPKKNIASPLDVIKLYEQDVQRVQEDLSKRTPLLFLEN